MEVAEVYSSIASVSRDSFAIMIVDISHSIRFEGMT